MDVTWLLDHWKELTAGTLMLGLTFAPLFKGDLATLWGKITKRLPAKTTGAGPTDEDAFAALQTLAKYAKATGNHSLSRSVIDAFDDVANVPEVDQ